MQPAAGWDTVQYGTRAGQYDRAPPMPAAVSAATRRRGHGRCGDAVPRIRWLVATCPRRRVAARQGDREPRGDEVCCGGELRALVTYLWLLHSTASGRCRRTHLAIAPNTRPHLHSPGPLATRSVRNTCRSALHHFAARLERSEATSRQSGWPAALQRVRMLERAQAVDGWDGTEVVRVSERN